MAGGAFSSKIVSDLLHSLQATLTKYPDGFAQNMQRHQPPTSTTPRWATARDSQNLMRYQATHTATTTQPRTFLSLDFNNKTEATRMAERFLRTTWEEYNVEYFGAHYAALAYEPKPLLIRNAPMHLDGIKNKGESRRVIFHINDRKLHGTIAQAMTGTSTYVSGSKLETLNYTEIPRAPATAYIYELGAPDLTKKKQLISKYTFWKNGEATRTDTTGAITELKTYKDETGELVREYRYAPNPQTAQSAIPTQTRQRIYNVAERDRARSPAHGAWWTSPQ